MGVLTLDNIGTVQNAIGHYTSHEPRYMHRAQVMATKFFDRGILRELLVTVRVP